MLFIINLNPYITNLKLNKTKIFVLNEYLFDYFLLFIEILILKEDRFGLFVKKKKKKH